ncbi:hypothetical protein FUT87_07445 [Mitsuaria sp. TWR114]|nr:ribbon-helix-helix domain-containing protein [Mitsuaria sp. TWR114]TXD94236.1 hypothetical protein FUT87_07445 [Mitsuaria sp. TWR114]
MVPGMVKSSLSNGVGHRAEAYVQPGRQGKKALVLYVDQPAHRAVKRVALSEDVTLECLIERALHDYLSKKGHKAEAKLLQSK